MSLRYRLLAGTAFPMLIQMFPNWPKEWEGQEFRGWDVPPHTFRFDEKGNVRGVVFE